MSESVPQPSLPEPSAELVLIGAFASAYMKTLSKKERIAFLREVGSILEWYSEFHDVVRIRPRAEDREMARARREAVEWFRRMVGVLITGRLDT